MGESADLDFKIQILEFLLNQLKDPAFVTASAACGDSATIFDNSISHFSCLASSFTTTDNLVISLSLASTSTSRATTQSKWQVQKVFFLLLFDGKLFMEYIFIISRYLIVYYLPSGLFVLVSWTSFIIPPEVIIN